MLRRDSYYKKEKRRKEKEYEQRIIVAVQQRQFYNRVQFRNDKFSKNYRQQPYGNRPLNDKKSTRRAEKFNKKGAKALKCYDCGYTPLTYSHKGVCKKNPNNKKNNKNRSKNSIVPTPAATMDTDVSSSDNDKSEQRFAVATIVPKKKKKEASKMGTVSECKHFNSNYFRKMANNNMNTNGLLYLPIILEVNAGIKVNTLFLLDTGCTFSAISPQLITFLI